MRVAGIICEYNPLHSGHAAMLRWLREQGAEAIVCAMSGHFVQRGEPAMAGKAARAEMALRCGADLVLELPTPWAAAGAETFARGGVALLRRTGAVDTLAFGSESGDTATLERIAAALDGEDCRAALRALPEEGMTFAARRQAAVAAVLGSADAALLAQPNDILAVEYLRALRGSEIRPLALRRQGAGHDAAEPVGDTVSASRVRALLRQGDAERALACMPDPAAEILRRELAAGRAPADFARCERAVLAHLRGMDEEAFIRYDGGGEGLYHRFYRAVRESATLEELLDLAKTKRYPMARLRRMVLAAWLELPEAPEEIPYVRVLAANETGRQLLRQMRGAPILTKPADVKRLGEEAEKLFRQEARWSDLYELACPVPRRCGEEWRMTPIMEK